MNQFLQGDRRIYYRHRGKASVVLRRDCVAAIPTLPGRVGDVSVNGVGLALAAPAKVDEFVTLEMDNPLNHMKVRLRARVRRVLPLEDGGFHVGCSLLMKLSEKQVRGLERGPMEL